MKRVHPTNRRSLSPRFLPVLRAWLCMILLLPGAPTAAWAQGDSLHQRLHQATTDSGRMRALYALGQHYLYSSPDSSRHYAQQLLHRAKASRTPQYIGHAYNLLGITHDMEGTFDSALFYFLTLEEHGRDYNDLKSQAIATNNLSISYQKLQEYHIALDYALQSYRMELIIPDSLGAAESLTNAGYQYFYLDQLDSAAAYFRRSLALLERLGNRPKQAYNFEGLGEIALLQGDAAEAIRWTEQAMNQWELEGNDYQQASASLVMGQALMLQNQTRVAKQYLDQAETLANRMGLSPLRMRVYLALSEWHEAQGDANEALRYLHLHLQRKDSVFNNRKARELATIEAQYEFAKKNNEIESLYRDRSDKDQTISSQRQISNILFISIAVLLSFLLITIRNYWRSVRTNRMLEVKREEIKKKNLEIVHQKYKALRASKAKSRFLAMMSHEIRTPMNAVIGITNLLLEESPRKDQEESLQTMKFSAENLLVLINDILDYNKIEAGKIEFESIPFNLKSLINSLRNTMKGKALEKGIAFEMDLDEQLPTFVQGDPTRLAQILTNLLSNAIKFTEQGSVSLGVELVAETDEKCHLAFTVKDTGIGISKEKLGSIFESFTQATSDITRRYGGTGLGLSITKKLIELQGSRIRVDSEPGQGTQFYFNLPFTRTAQAPRSETDLLTTGKRDLKGVRVLLAEDNQVNELVARRFLTKWGVSVDAAVNGQEAVEQVQAQLYDLVLMDLQMPVMDGFKATRKIRALPDSTFRSLPIIALTASAMNEIRAKAFEAGVTDFIAKPFNPDELRAVLEKYVLRNDHELID